MKNAIQKNAEILGINSFKNYKSPMAKEYHPEEDSTPLLDSQGISKYRSLIGTANWVVTLGRFDIDYAVNTMSRYNNAPREVHLKAVMRSFGYIDKYPNGRIIINPTEYNSSIGTPARDEKWG